ncbi:hypothetical protein GCM10010399_64770 [Dactylosporangium fulvum]|uniref:Glycosyltransferase n=1 Tax=Dactylosporangium fulvum TaxID=53359 RepID=A0ABY5VY91_9ACTN|nr:hypothetical protein [Dactylosporangium fulvum]UWP82115.1 hypothetical protein Dfulv_44805 [Dactylosporangium fulvum]
MRPAEVNAVIVPTARPYTYLREAAKLARDLESQLVVLCSGWADAERSCDLATDYGVRAVAVDVGGESVPRLPDFRTSELLRTAERGLFDRKTDTSLKRNIGLALAWMVGWRFVLFLDDDIRVENARDIQDAAALAETHTAVGLINYGFPDNSVVCHAYRKVGGPQGTFVGGGSLVVQVRAARSFFPSIYNEDWFFLLNGRRLDPVAMVGKVDQKEYDPFRNADRARGEELGDTLAEGVYALLDDGKDIAAADTAYWKTYLQVRRDFIQHVLDRIPRAAVATENERDRMVVALKGAQGRSRRITPELCVAYLRAWADDRRDWQRYLGKLPYQPSAEAALRHLGLRPHVS